MEKRRPLTEIYGEKTMHLKERVNQLTCDIFAVWMALKDRDTPIHAKILGGIAVGYALSPIDLIPDFIPVLGCLDDVVILPALVALTVKCIPEEVWNRSKEKSAGLWKDGLPQKWPYAIPVAAVWLVILWCLARAVLR